MKYKILNISTIAIMILSLFAIPFAYAEETDDSSDAIALYDDTSDVQEGMVISPGPTQNAEETEAELGLDEEVSNGKIFGKQLGLLFTFNQEKKAQKELELAKLRLIQAKVAAKNGNSEAMEKALEAHERIIARVQTRIENLDGTSNAEELSDSAYKFTALENSISVHERRVVYLTTALENSELTDVQKARIEAKLQNAQEKTQKLTELQETKIDKLKTRLMAVSDLTEEQAQEIIEVGRERVRESRGDYLTNENLNDRTRYRPNQADDSKEDSEETEIETEEDSSDSSGSSNGQNQGN